MCPCSQPTRRELLRFTFFGAALAGIASAPSFGGWAQAAEPSPDLLHDTINGLLAFVVPGSDDYSVAQGARTPNAGGVALGVADTLIATLDETTPFIPHFSATVAGILNIIAQAVDPAASRGFQSPFANLTFGEKVAVMQIMDDTDSLKPLAGVLLAFVAFFCYAEAWPLSSYQGVADGRDEFLGYFSNDRAH